MRTASGTSATIAITESAAKLLTASNGPAAKAVTAPQRFDSASMQPCAEARVLSAITALNKAEAAMATNDHPIPSRTRQTAIHRVSSGNAAPMISDATKTAIPAAIVRR